LYASPNTAKAIKLRMKRAEHVACMREMTDAYKILVRKCEGKRPQGRPRETGWDDVIWIHLAQDRHQWWALVNTGMNLQVP